jgi:glycosyltransferase involved in cell wall biosynthesis
MYKLSVGAVLKNESQSIKEWIEHYLFHGAEHFYLIDDQSTDNTIEIIQPYIDKGIVTLFSSDWSHYRGRQKDMYNHFILPHLNESKWLLIVDLDEYVWSQYSINLNNVLVQCNHMGQIQVENTIFGSNGHVEQPKSIVASFTRRCAEHPTINTIHGNRKYFVNSSFDFSSLNIHHATFVDKNDELNNFQCLTFPWFIMNHYVCQSKNFWNSVKCTRGDADSYKARKPEHFIDYDLNDVEDTELYEQNKSICNSL